MLLRQCLAAQRGTPPLPCVSDYRRGDESNPGSPYHESNEVLDDLSIAADAAQERIGRAERALASGDFAAAFDLFAEAGRDLEAAAIHARDAYGQEDEVDHED